MRVSALAVFVDADCFFMFAGVVMKAKVQFMENSLEDERRLRREAEQVVKDVERECKVPFVVPALLQAFVSISKLTSEVVGKGKV